MITQFCFESFCRDDWRGGGRRIKSPVNAALRFVRSRAHSRQRNIKRTQSQRTRTHTRPHPKTSFFMLLSVLSTLSQAALAEATTAFKKSDARSPIDWNRLCGVLCFLVPRTRARTFVHFGACCRCRCPPCAQMLHLDAVSGCSACCGGHHLLRRLGLAAGVARIVSLFFVDSQPT